MLTLSKTYYKKPLRAIQQSANDWGGGYERIIIIIANMHLPNDLTEYCKNKDKLIKNN